MFNDAEAKHDAELELEPAEVLLWYSRPNPKQVAKQSMPICIFAIPWTLFAIFWTMSAFGMTATHHNVNVSDVPSSPMESFFPLFGIPFILIGLGMLTAPYWASLRANFTTYAVTNRRVFIVQGGATRTVQSFVPEEIGNLQRSELADGSGNLMFARRNCYDSQGRTQSMRVQFLGVPNVRSVEQLIRDTFQSTGA